MTQEEFNFRFIDDPQKLRDLIDEEGRKIMAKMEDRYLVMAGELMLAGWKPEYDRPDTRCMAWCWRRPPKTAWTRGRLFRSTDQAWNAMMKE
jgi:hypothetical protein